MAIMTDPSFIPECDIVTLMFLVNFLRLVIDLLVYCPYKFMDFYGASVAQLSCIGYIMTSVERKVY